MASDATNRDLANLAFDYMSLSIHVWIGGFGAHIFRRPFGVEFDRKS